MQGAVARGALGAGILAGAMASACAPGAARGPDGREGPVVCVTVQRGALGEVEDASIAPNVTTAGWSPTTLRVSGGHEAVLRFDLGAVPRGVIVKSATLNLRVQRVFTRDALDDVRARRILVPWSESTVTFASLRQQVDHEIAGRMAGPRATGAQQLPLEPALVQGWLDGSIPNHGVLLESTSGRRGPKPDCELTSSEGRLSAARPALQVCYYPVDPRGDAAAIGDGGRP